MFTYLTSALLRFRLLAYLPPLSCFSLACLLACQPAWSCFPLACLPACHLGLCPLCLVVFMSSYLLCFRCVFLLFLVNVVQESCAYSLPLVYVVFSRPWSLLSYGTSNSLLGLELDVFIWYSFSSVCNHVVVLKALAKRNLRPARSTYCCRTIISVAVLCSLNT